MSLFLLPSRFLPISFTSIPVNVPFRRLSSGILVFSSSFLPLVPLYHSSSLLHRPPSLPLVPPLSLFLSLPPATVNHFLLPLAPWSHDEETRSGGNLARDLSQNVNLSYSLVNDLFQPENISRAIDEGRGSVYFTSPNLNVCFYLSN